MAYGVKFQNATRTKNKYNAKGQNYNGKWYHSKKEARYAEELDWLKKGGHIQSWERQVKIDLTVNGVHITNYYCDFKVINRHGGVELHEVKGMVLPEFQIKWKLLQALKDELYPEGVTLVLVK